MSELTQEQIATQEQAKTLVSNLRKGKELHDAFGLAFEDRYLIAKQSFQYWKEHFKIEIPTDLNPQQCRDLNIEILRLYQEATFYKLLVDGRSESLKGTNYSSYRQAFTRLVQQYKDSGQRLPSKDTLETLANESTKDITDAIVHTDIELAFWKGIINSLDTCRKILETVSISLSVEAKALQNERYLDNLVNKKQFGGD